MGSGFSSLALASPTLRSPANLQNPEYRVCLLGSRNVAGSCPIGAIYPSGRKYEKEEIRENVRGRAKKCRKLGLRSSLSMAPTDIHAPITRPALVALKSCGSSGLVSLAFAHSTSATFWLASARQNVAGLYRYAKSPQERSWSRAIHGALRKE